MSNRGPSFEALRASELHCPRCRQARPVHERLLLILPDGELFEFRCAFCGSSLATRTVRKAPGRQGLVTPE